MGSPRKNPAPTGSTALYRFYAADGELLYVGITADVEVRWAAHQRDKIWWLDVARKEHVWLDSRTEAEEREKEAIRTEQPRYDRSLEGRRSPTGTFTYARPLRDAYQEGIVAAVEARMAADIRSGVIPEWSILRKAGALAESYSTSTASVDHSLRRLSSDKLLTSVWSRYVAAPSDGFPRRAAEKHGALYVVAHHHFGDRPFTAQDAARYTPGASASTVSQHLAKLCRTGVAKCIARKPTGRYVIVCSPEPDPDPPRSATAEDMQRMEAWLSQQVHADLKAAKTANDLLLQRRLERDVRIVAACTRTIFGATLSRDPDVLSEMAYFYADRPGFQEVWVPEWAGGPRKP